MKSSRDEINAARLVALEHISDQVVIVGLPGSVNPPPPMPIQVCMTSDLRSVNGR